MHKSQVMGWATQLDVCASMGLSESVTLTGYYRKTTKSTYTKKRKRLISDSQSVNHGIAFSHNGNNVIPPSQIKDPVQNWTRILSLPQDTSVQSLRDECINVSSSTFQCRLLKVEEMFNWIKVVSVFLVVDRE